MRRYSSSVAFLVVLVVCCSLAATYTPAHAAGALSHVAAPRTLNMGKLSVANDGTFLTKDVRGAQQQQQDGHAPQMERGVHEDAKELRAAAAVAANAAAPTMEELAAGDDASPAAASAEIASTDSAVPSTEAKTGTILSGGVIASATIVLVFACLLVGLVLIEMGTIINGYLEHRRWKQYRMSKNGDDPAEPKYGDFRDTAGNVQP